MPLHEIAFWSAVFFLAGTLGASIAPINAAIISTFLVIVTVLIGSILLRLPKLVRLSLLAFWFLAGFLYYQIDDAQLKSMKLPPSKSAAEFTGVVQRDPNYQNNTQELIISLNAPYRGTILVRASRYPEFHYGDLLRVEGTVTPLIGTSAHYFLKERVTGTVSFPRVSLIAHNHGSKIRSILFSFKHNLIAHIQKVLPYEHAALLSGITLGERGEFSNELKDAMQKSGTLHIVALSGYNISIVAWVIAQTLGRYLRRKIAFLITMGTIVGFVVMTGVEASVVRAGIMGLLILIANQSGRVYSFRNALALTALLMVLQNPKVLAFDVGFQLSFAALMGIVYLKPVLAHFIHQDEHKGILQWKENLTTTAAAQIAVIPILLNAFHNFSFVSLLSNILILETIPLAMFLGFAIGIVGFFNYTISLVIGWFTHLVLSYQIAVITFTARISEFLHISAETSYAALALYYGCLVGFVIVTRRHARAHQ